MESLEKSLMDIKDFEKGLRCKIEEEIIMLRSIDKNIKSRIYREGFAVYKSGRGKVVSATIHAGGYVPKGVVLRQNERERKKEEDLFTGELYLPVFLENGGYWITSHISRYFVDLNRPKEKAILLYDAHDGATNWAGGNDRKKAEQAAKEYYESFYRAASEILGNADFIFSGHSMNNKKGRGDFCLIFKETKEGVHLQNSLQRRGFNDVKINDPFAYENGYFRVFADSIADGRSVEFETNKRLYMEEKESEKLDSFEHTSREIAGAIKECIDDR